MLFLILTVLLNVFLSVVFKIFARFKVDNLQAIVVNYWICVATGSVFLGHFPVGTASLQQAWAPWALLMGAGFISIFNLIAYCTKTDGITTTTIANKLSMVIPAGFALWLYGDRMTIGKGLGILLAFPAVYLSTRTQNAEGKKQQLFWPLVLFIGSGLLDTLVNYVAKQYFSGGSDAANAAGQSVFLIHTFSVAGTIGLLLVIILLLLRKRTFEWKNVIAGCLLGVPNYFSIYFFFRLLQSGFLSSSAAIPVNNVAIVLCAALTAIFFFREKATLPRIIGLALSITAILLIALSDGTA